jgi:hypothetical protein
LSQRVGSKHSLLLPTIKFTKRMRIIIVDSLNDNIY